MDRTLRKITRVIINIIVQIMIGSIEQKFSRSGAVDIELWETYCVPTVPHVGVSLVGNWVSM